MFDHLLVPIDGSKLSDKAVTHAVALARTTQARITLLHVVPDYPTQVYAEGMSVGLATRRDYNKIVKEEAAKLLDRTAGKVKGGVDVAVSTPRMLAAMVEEAVNIGDLVRLMTLRQGQANLVEVTLPEDTQLAGRAVRDLTLPADSALVTILRGGRVIVPQADDSLEPGDELLFVATVAVEEDIRAAVVGP